MMMMIIVVKDVPISFFLVLRTGIYFTCTRRQVPIEVLGMPMVLPVYLLCSQQFEDGTSLPLTCSTTGNLRDGFLIDQEAGRQVMMHPLASQKVRKLEVGFAHTPNFLIERILSPGYPWHCRSVKVFFLFSRRSEISPSDWWCQYQSKCLVLAPILASVR